MTIQEATKRPVGPVDPEDLRGVTVARRPRADGPPGLLSSISTRAWVPCALLALAFVPASVLANPNRSAKCARCGCEFPFPRLASCPECGSDRFRFLDEEETPAWDE